MDWIRLPEAVPSFGAMVGWAPQPLPVLPLIGVLLAAWYGWGVYRVTSSGRVWPWTRTASFLFGCILLILVTGLAVEGYGYELFSIWMFQHLTLSMAIPPLLVLGSPGLLLLRSTPHTGWGNSDPQAGIDGTQKPDGEDSATPRRHDSTVPVQLLRHLPLAGIRPGGVVLGRSHRPGALLPGHWSVVHRSGALIWAVARQAKQPGSMFRPLRRNASPCFHRRDPDDGNLATPEYLHQSAGVLERRSDGRSTNGGALAWSYGEPVALIIMVVFAMRWNRDETRTNAAVDKKAARDGDVDLEAYNEFLKTLPRR